MFTSKKQLLFRFLKENDLLYNETLATTLKKVISNDEEYSLYRGEIGIKFFDNNLNWDTTKEGRLFWIEVNSKFITFIIDNDKNYCFDKDKVKRYFDYFLSENYFYATNALLYNDSSNLYKGSLLYNNLLEKYKKTYGSNITKIWVDVKS